jgi:hypothetical protein
MTAAVRGASVGDGYDASPIGWVAFWVGLAAFPTLGRVSPKSPLARPGIAGVRGGHRDGRQSGALPFRCLWRLSSPLSPWRVAEPESPRLAGVSSCHQTPMPGVDRQRDCPK